MSGPAPAPGSNSQKLVPAEVGFLAIYNPSLGNTDDTLDDQIVYYSSPESRKRKRRRVRTGVESPVKSSQDERNERLRKIGLAQAMVEFGKDFSDGKPVDTIETEKSRIVLHELEPGWWLIASIDLTRLPAPKGNTGDENAIEYSSREVKPPALLLEDLLRAHCIFLLHHASSMSALFVRIRRSKFVNLLGRYWDSFLSTWNVMLHGNPVVNVFGGIKLASSGELGMGVGEEDRGSGEREVLEGFVGRVDGLVDLVVSKFSGPETDAEEEKGTGERESHINISPNRPWLGTGAEPSPDDGAIFLGVGALSRKSLCDVAHWMEDLYSWGSRAYGVRDNPTATRRLRKKNENKKPEVGKPPSPLKLVEDSPPRAILQLRPAGKRRSTDDHTISAADSQGAISPIREVSDPYGRRPKEKRPALQRGRSSQSSTHSITNTGGKIVNYLKLGYGTHWSLSGNTNKTLTEHEIKTAKTDAGHQSQPMNRGAQTDKLTKAVEQNYDDGSESSPVTHDDSVGHYLIGLMGDIEKDEVDFDPDDMTTDEGAKQSDNFRMLLRTVTVELERERDARPETDISIDLGTVDNTRSQSSNYGGSEHTGTSHASFESQDRNKTKKLRIVVYVKKPFIFIFLFELRTDALALMSLYKSLHYQLGPLQKPLLASTSRPLPQPDINITNAQDAKTPIYDLVWDSKSLTISSTMPNIPEPTSAHFSSRKPPPWSRIEALNTHMQLLNTFVATRNDRSQIEHTCKTSRGWWIVWNRILDPADDSASNFVPLPAAGNRTPLSRQEDDTKMMRSGNTSFTGTNSASMYSGPAHPFLDRDRSSVTAEQHAQNDKEIFLLRRASDYSDGKASGRFVGLTSSTSDSGWGSGAAKLAQGIGVDTKKYIEGLLNR